MNQPHPHAASMLLYAQDAAETDKPWERWEFKHKSETDWRNNAESDFGWLSDFDYRRKPQTITVNGIEVPEPMRREPENTEVYFLAYPIFEELFIKEKWDASKTEKTWLEKGLIHNTREAAIAHAKAMIAPSQRK